MSKKKNKNKPETIKQQSLGDALEAIEKEFGQGSIRQGLDSGGIVKCDYIPTGSISLDVTLGGGIPRERITEIFGPEGCGKTTLALHIVSNVQRSGGVAVYIDVEHAVDKQYAQNLGVDLDSLIFSQPNSAEQVFLIIEKLIGTGQVDIVVVDSVAALATRAELDGEIEDTTIAGTARLMSKCLRRIAGVIRENNAALIFINQLRHKIGVTFGSNETTPGGRSLKYYASVRLDLRRIAFIKGEDKKPAGNLVKAQAVKNRVAPPFRQAEFEIIFGKGINTLGDLLDTAVNAKIIERRGSNYYLEQDMLGAGRTNTIKHLEEHPSISTRVREELVRSLLPHLVKDNAEESNADKSE